ncbi:MAG: hypothetical protein EHM58_17175 [Ignavibacteriae bacterium]|nr:MAG: hypothetical protein EHM58_17175 [Ignavibacteriota bacterium]
MERLKRKIKCDTLKKDVSVTYFVETIKNSDGTIKKKAVQYYNCEGQEQCEEKSNIMQCACFKELRKVEMEVNTLTTAR